MSKVSSNKVAIITGGSRGVGAATAKLLASKGWNVTITCTSSMDDANSVVKECEKSGNSKAIEQIELMDWERDFKRSKAMSSWTSTHAMFVFVTVGYYYMAKILDIPYEVTFFP